MSWANPCRQRFPPAAHQSSCGAHLPGCVARGLILLPLGLRLLEGRPALLGSTSADDPAAAIVPIDVPLMAGPGTISLVVSEAPDAWTGRLLVSLVIGAMAMGLYLFLQFTPRLRGWLGHTRERVLQRLMGLLFTLVAVQILVIGLKGCFPTLAREMLGRGKNEPCQFAMSPERHAC